MSKVEAFVKVCNFIPQIFLTSLFVSNIENVHHTVEDGPLFVVIIHF